MRLGIDTGGTYTDAVLFDEAKGVLKSAKALTTKHDLAIGVGEAIEKVLPEDPSQVRMVALSTTLATNSVVEGQGSPVGLLLLGYDQGALGRGGLKEALGGDPVAFIDGGHGSSGDEAAPLDLEAARAAVLDQAKRVSAFVVAGYFSVRNPGHEIRLREFIREETGLPVTCAHELTTNLDAPRRAMTAVLNGRLIPLLQTLILAVESKLKENGVKAPLMVVKGDGSLLAAEAALVRPIETVLSGPAASVVGARYLCGEDDVVVSDIGGTTTDIALLRNGKVTLDREGARVGGWRTMVEAVAVHTFGLGGDSEIRLDKTKALVAGPRRCVPLALLARDHPKTLLTLHRQTEKTEPEDHDGRFALRLRALEVPEESLTSGERRIWHILAEGPVALEELLEEPHLARPLDRLIDRGLVIQAAFTPSDASHCLERQTIWSKEAASLGAQIWAQRLQHLRMTSDADPQAFAEMVFEQLVVQSAKALISASLNEEDLPALDQGGVLGTALVERAIRQAGDDSSSVLGLKVDLKRALVGIGAPAATYYPEIAKRLSAPGDYSRACRRHQCRRCRRQWRVAGCQGPDHGPG